MSITMNHGVKIQILLENLRTVCHYFVEVSNSACSRVKKYHDSGRIAFMRTACGGKISKCELGICHFDEKTNGTEIWEPEEGAIGMDELESEGGKP